MKMKKRLLRKRLLRLLTLRTIVWLDRRPQGGAYFAEGDLQSWPAVDPRVAEAAIAASESGLIRGLKGSDRPRKGDISSDSP